MDKIFSTAYTSQVHLTISKQIFYYITAENGIKHSLPIIYISTILFLYAQMWVYTIV